MAGLFVPVLFAALAGRGAEGAVNEDCAGLQAGATHVIARDMPGLRPAPYLASRGMKWIQRYALPGLDDEQLRDYLAASHQLVAVGLSRNMRRELGLDD